MCGICRMQVLASRVWLPSARHQGLVFQADLRAGGRAVELQVTTATGIAFDLCKNH